MKENYLAIALGKKDVGESDRQYVFYTREEGLLYVRARGVRKVGAKLASHIEDFMLTQIIIAKNFGPGTLAGASAENTFREIRMDYDAMCVLSHTRNLFIKLIQTKHKDQKIFDLFKRYLEVCTENLSKEKTAIFEQYFFLKLYEILGYRFPLARCRICEKKLEQERNFLCPEQGGVLCSSCARTENYIIAMDINTLKLLRLVPHNNLNQLTKVEVSPIMQRQMQSVVRQTAQWIMR